MEFFLGLLTAVVFFIAFYLGTRYGNKKPSITVDDEEVKKAKQNRKEFINMMNYNVETATARKKVT